MMNSNPTSKIVVGVGLAAVFGVGASFYVMHASHEAEVARNAPSAAATPLGPDPAAATDPNAPAQTSAAGAPGVADQSAMAAAAPAPAVAPSPMPAEAAPTASAPVASATTRASGAHT